MFTRCLVCAAPFAANGVLERMPLGRRLAFDPGRGRLWVVCRSCRRWSLMPIEDRWEALEELQQHFVAGVVVLAQTENIALLRAGPLELVRVGGAGRTEEAWWRYGSELLTRKRNWDRLGIAGRIAAGAAVAGGWAAGGFSMLGVWLIMGHGRTNFRDGARWLRFGRFAWQGRASCAACGHELGVIRFSDRNSLGIFAAPDGGEIEIVSRCPGCGLYRGAGLHLKGDEAGRTLRRVLAFHHFAGASEQRVARATRLLEEAGSARDLARIVVQGGKRLGDLPRTGAIALEMAANESMEQTLLQLDVAELRARWRREEELAAISDGELTPLPSPGPPPRASHPTDQ